MLNPNQYTITSSAWTQISTPGESITVCLDDDNEQSGDRADVRIWRSATIPSEEADPADDPIVSKAARVLRRTRNDDFLPLAAKQDAAIFWARCKNAGDTAILSVDSGIGVSRVDGDVSLQDQSSPIVDRFITRKLGTATLAAPTVADTRTLTLSSGHGFVIGNMIEIDDGTRSYQSRVTNVATNTLTVTNPITCAFQITATVRRTSADMNVNGSVTPVVFTCKPPINVRWDINILSVNMLDDVVMDDAKFGGITALTNGVVFRTVDGDIEHIFTALDNGCFRRHCDTDNPYSDKAPSGVFGFNAKRRFNSQTGDGVSRRLGTGASGEFQVVIQDDLTGLQRFWAVLRGHIIEEV